MILNFRELHEVRLTNSEQQNNNNNDTIFFKDKCFFTFLIHLIHSYSGAFHPRGFVNCLVGTTHSTNFIQMMALTFLPQFCPREWTQITRVTPGQ